MMVESSCVTTKPVIPKVWTEPMVDPKSVEGLQSNFVCSNEFRRTPSMEVCYFIEVVFMSDLTTFLNSICSQFDICRWKTNKRLV